MYLYFVGAGFKSARNQQSRPGIPVVRPSLGGFETRPDDFAPDNADFVPAFNRFANIKPNTLGMFPLMDSIPVGWGTLDLGKHGFRTQRLS